MNKNITKILIVAVLIALFSHNQASASLFDGTKDTKGNTSLLSSLYVGTNFSLSSLMHITDTSASNDVLTVQNNSVIETPSVSKTPAKASAKKTYTVSVSGYSSTPDQTDDSPFITARGTYVRDGIVAANFLPFGTAIKIPAMFGDKIFVVEDRMNTRFSNNVDIWFASRQSALNFGRRTLAIEIVTP